MKLVFYRCEPIATIIDNDGNFREEKLLILQGSVYDVQDVDLNEDGLTATVYMSDEIILYDIPRDKFEIVGNQNSSPPTCCS